MTMKCPPLLGDHLQANPRRKYGVPSARMVPCATKPNTHAAHPEDESCPDCPSWYEAHAAEVAKGGAAAFADAALDNAGYVEPEYLFDGMWP